MSYVSPPPGSEAHCLTRGWMNGWMDGSVGRQNVFLVYFSKTTRHTTLIILAPPRRCFKVSAVKK